MLKCKVVLRKTEIRDYSPVTASSDKISRKLELLQKLEAKIGTKLPEIQKLSKDKRLTIEVCYYLSASDKDGKPKKDLDNLLKILFDVLSENMNNGQEDIHKGLGIMKNDTFVYKIKCEKKENFKDREGLDLKILAM